MASTMKMARHQSPWLKTPASQSYARASGRHTADVVVVGGGLTGLTLATLLKQRGMRVIVLEARRVGEGATGHGAARLTSTLEQDYATLVQRWGFATTQKLVLARHDAIDTVATLAEQQAPHAEFRRRTEYWLATHPRQLNALRGAFEDFRSLYPGIAWVDALPEHRALAAVAFANQATFHPTNYVRDLAAFTHGKGSIVFENSPVVEVNAGSTVCIKTRTAQISAAAVVLATHTPIGLSPLHAQLTPRRLLAMCIQTDAPLAQGLCWDFGTTHYYHAVAGQGYVLTTTQCDNANLNAFAQRHLGARALGNVWSADVFETPDGLPWVGASPGAPNVWVACGLGTNGLTWGTLAAEILADALCQQKHPLDELLTPARGNAVAKGSRQVQEHVNVALACIKDRLRPAEIASVHTLARGQGALVTLGGQKVAAFRDPQGTLHTFLAACTHQQCIVQWNSSELTWDCPFHGGRFFATGEVLCAPPTQPLVPIDIEAGKKDR